MIYLCLALIVILATFAYGGLSAAPWVPMRRGDVDRFLALAEIKSGEKVYDLGCGDGRTICAAAKAGARAEGFEVSLLPYLLSQFRRLVLRKSGHDVTIHYKNFWHARIDDADVIYFFLMPKCYPRLKVKLEKELKPGARVIAYVWPIDGWEPVKIDTAPGKPNLYLYRR